MDSTEIRRIRWIRNGFGGFGGFDGGFDGFAGFVGFVGFGESATSRKSSRLQCPPGLDKAKCRCRYVVAVEGEFGDQVVALPQGFTCGGISEYII